MYILNKPVVLCGFMASGKTTIGKLAAHQWNLNFYDTDAMIVTRTGMTIPEIFCTAGESEFRELEHDICRELASFPPCIISSGGGLLTFERNALLLKKRTIIVLIHRDFDQTWAFLSTCSNRPLIRSKSKEDVLAMYEARLPIYRKYADIEIENNSSPGDCLSALQKCLKIV